MESQTPNVIGTIAAIFSLIALVVGLFSRKVANATRNGVIVGALCVALFLALLFAGGAPSGNFNWAYAGGRLAGYGLMAIVFSLLGYGIRKLFSLFFGLFRKA